jgi:chemotaxis protein MotB
MELDELPTEHMKPRSIFGAVGFSVVMTLLAAGLSYYAFQLWTQQERVSQKLRKTKVAMVALEKEHATQTKKVVELEQTSNEQHERLTQDDAELLTLKEKLAAAEAGLNELQSEREELNARVEEWKRMTKQFQRMIDSGKLSINFRRGRMIVELPAAVLFASGSADLSSDGQTSLKEVAKILRQVPGKHFIVGGHTDDIPIAKPQSGFSSNWALSAARAVTVTEALIEAGLKPARLVAAGYGPYDPIAANSNAKARQKNRRIEIVLEPDLRELPKSLKPDAKSKAEPKAAK